jgi:hypothetical protein
MSNRAECDECRAIVEELRGAFAEVQASPKLRDELRVDCQAVFGVLGGAEEDPERVEEVIAKFQFRPGTDTECRTPRIRDAFRKMGNHCLRTGHGILFRE